MRIKVASIGLILSLLTPITHAIQDNFTITDASRTLVRLIGGMLLDAINSLDYLFLLGIVIISLFVILTLLLFSITFSFFIMKKLKVK